MPDLTFSSKGAAQVLADQQKLKDGAKAMSALYKEENREMAKLGRDAAGIFQQTRTESEKLRIQAEKLRAIVANTKLPDIDRAKAADALKRVEGKLQDVSTAGTKADGVLKQAFGATKTALLGSFATGVGAVTAAVGLTIKAVTDELRAAQELANKAAATQLSVGASRNVVIRNLPGADAATINQVLRENADLAGTTGVSETAINQARASALSASGGNLAASLSATDIAAKFLADRPGEIGDFAGSLLDLSKVTGTTDANANLGLLSSVGGLSRITDQRQQAQSIPAALIGAREFGLSTSESAALFSTLTTASGDLTGKTSGTATIQLAKQLEAFTGGDGSLAGLSTGEKLRRVQGNQSLAQEFMEGASFEVKALGPIRALLTNASSDAAQSFAENLRKIPEMKGLAAIGEQSLAAFDNNELEGRAKAKRALDQLVETLQVSKPAERLSDEEREKLMTALQEAGYSYLGARAELFNYGGGLTFDKAQSVVKDIRAEILGEQSESQLSAKDQALIEQLSRLNEEYKRNADLAEQGNADRKKQTEEIKRSRGMPAGGG